MALLGYYCTIIIMGIGLATAVTLVNNGYEDVYIVINKGVKENPQLLSRIKNIFTEGSRHLFESTQNQAYFRKIIIVIPESWTLSHNYKMIYHLPYSREIIMVDNPSNRGNKPYVYRAEGCGAPGLFLHLTPELILHENMPDGDTWGHIIAREWSKLRWGLFNEMAMDDGPQFFLNNGTWKPVTYMRGRALEKKSSKPCDFSSTSIYPPTECIFCPVSDQDAEARDPFDHESVDKTLRYTALAPNEQNIRCDYRSAWEIMRDHVDFKQKVNDPRNSNTETEPVIDIITYNPSFARKGVYHFVVEVDVIADIFVYFTCITLKNEPQLVTVDSWLSHTEVDYKKETDLKVFVFVKRGMFPVVHADIVAVLKRPDSTAVTLDLNDNGLGTDLTKDDGIYTGNIFRYYFSSNGRYSVNIIVTGGRNAKLIKRIPDQLSSCSGKDKSVIYETIDNFQRTSLLENLYVINFEEPFQAEPNEANDKIIEIRTLLLLEDVNAQISPLTTEKNIEVIDNIPPSKISNFYQVSYEESEGIIRCFHFRWTAVGNDRDVGQAMKYNIRYSTNGFDLLTNFDKCLALNNNTMVPKIAGDTEELFVIGDVDNTNSLKESFIAINAVDWAGNAAKISNIAIIPHTVNLTIVPLGTKCVVKREPPSRITDLKLHTETYTHANDGMIVACFELTWTAVGDEGNDGQAYAYEMLYSEEVSDLVLFHRTHPIRNTVVPLKAGGKETVVVGGILGFNYTSRRQYITVRTVSKRRVYSDISNYIDIPFVLNLTLPSNTTTCRQPDSSVESTSSYEIIIASCCLILPFGVFVARRIRN
ncbi:hypothetical protein ACJMK2_018190 [Sinanodonta woodiana]|uniref:Calcium-activated chloride channel N-terminal domain-containing protein n=1 Tax=Sinanodonta woodiana TaxID=1069815 RepID=A0ABD3UFV9_SINWO